MSSKRTGHSSFASIDFLSVSSGDEEKRGLNFKSLMLDLWPPELPDDKLHQLSQLAVDWCTAHGCVMAKEYPTSIHAPFALCILI